jgi:lipopolysaccharide biosynthesis glycosyltransferase
MIDLAVGFDQKEAVAYHTFCQSVINKTSQPVRFTPLIAHGMDGKRDGSNEFIYSRFLVPYLFGYKGWAIYADGDMVCQADIAKLWALRDDKYAVQVVQHSYRTKHKRKYFGAKNEDYPRKNWSSLVLWNCEHSANRMLNPKAVSELSNSFLHRFQWLHDGEIGELPLDWNWLVMEYPENDHAALLHYTIGTPCFADFADCEMSVYWHIEHKNSQEGKNA